MSLPSKERWLAYEKSIYPQEEPCHPGLHGPETVLGQKIIHGPVPEVELQDDNGSFRGNVDPSLRSGFK